MRCPYCGDRRTEVLKTVYRGHSSYRHRRCLYCGSRFSTQERPVRWSRVERKWPGPRPLRKGWRNRRTPALRGKCEVETCGVDFKQAGIKRHVDHIVPARLIRRLKAGNPDRRENLQCICGICHGYKLQADHKLCMGDKLGYLEVRDPRITRKSLEDACKTGRLTASLHDQLLDAKESAAIPREEGPAPTPSTNSIPVAPGGPSKPPRSCRAKRIWADVARQLNVDASVIEQLIFRGVLKLYDSRVTEKSLTRFCARYGALIKSDFLDAETRDWLAGCMDLAPSAGKDEAGRLEAFRKHALVVRTCEHCGRPIRGNVFFRHRKACPQRNGENTVGGHS
jgi:hypothetical protein